MESLSWVAIVISAFLTSLAVICKLIKPQKNYPPGPKPWPIIGNLNLLGACPHKSFSELSKKYGELMLLKFGSLPVVVASSPAMAREILKTHDQTFCSRPSNAAVKYTNYNGQDLVWAPYGPHSRQARKIYIQEFLGAKQIDTYEYIRVEERRTFMTRLAGLPGQKIVVRGHLAQFALSNASRMVYGDNYFSETVSDQSTKSINSTSGLSVEESRDMLVEWFYLNGVFNLGDWIPWLGLFDLQGYVKRMKILSKKLDNFNSFVIAKHMERREKEKENFVAKDVVDVILQLAEDPNLEVKLNSDSVKGLVQDLIIGTVDTTITTIEWALSELLKNPRILIKATEEMDRVIGKERWIEEKDISQLPYMEAIVNETLRLHPPATLLVPHFSMEDREVSGYHIPKGTTVFVNVWAMARNSKYWEEAERFWPERFLGSKIDAKGQYFELVPFGAGRRMCPGYLLGLRLIQTTLANMLQGFEWKLPETLKPEDITMEEQYGITTKRANPLEAVVKPRLHAHLY